MFTKGEKIMHSINHYMRENGESSGVAALHRAASEVRTAGGSFTAKDVARLLEIAAQVALGADGRAAAGELSKEYRKSVSDIRLECVQKVRDAEEKAENEYERAREEFKERIDELERDRDYWEDKAEEYDNVRDAVGDEIMDALYSMRPVDTMLNDDVRALAEYIREYGKGPQCYRLAM
jgi:hypothetical protein